MGCGGGYRVFFRGLADAGNGTAAVNRIPTFSSVLAKPCEDNRLPQHVAAESMQRREEARVTGQFCTHKR